MTTGKLTQRQRTLALIFNFLIAVVVHRCVSGRWSITANVSDAWLIAMGAYWLLSLISAPYFRPPKDSLANGVGALIALATLSVGLEAGAGPLMQMVKGFGVLLAAMVIMLAILAISASAERRESTWSKFSYRLSNELGRGELLFTPVVLISAFSGYGDNIPAALSILVLWTLAISAGAFEFLLRIKIEFWPVNEATSKDTLLGRVERFDSPGVVRVLLGSRARWDCAGICALALPDGKQVAALPLFENPGVEGRIGTAVVTTVLQGQLPNVTELDVHMHPGTVSREQLLVELSGMSDAQLAGIIVEGSSIGAVRFEAIGGDLAKGQVVAVIVDTRRVFYQITDAITGEEHLSNQLHGRRVASAIQLGEYMDDRGFSRYDWVPPMNSLVFLVSKDFEFPYAPSENQFPVGLLPSTQCGIYADVDELVHYHAAILGVTGTGKTELALDSVRAAVERGCKVVCVDFTGEYAKRLADLDPLQLGLTADLGKRYEDAIFAVETGTYGAPAEKAALKAFVDRINPAISAQVDAFLSGDRALAVLELAEIMNTKATLRTTELFLSAFMAWAKSNRRRERILLVLEEAHTIIPETGGSGMDFESKWVVDRIGQIALQGRKYGIGLLVVSQRTALVSKTILSQCNTFFVFSLVDQTSLTFLTSVLSAEHVLGIPNLKNLEMVCYGRAVSSERPLITGRVYDPDKASQAAAMDAPSRRDPS